MSKTHLQSGPRRTPTYIAWASMKQRCSRRASYIDRGIKVCSEWKKDFNTFVCDVGCKPGKGFWLERVDNNKGYERGNVIWATPKVQERNRSNNHILTHGGVSMPIAAWAEAKGFGTSIIYRRIYAGWSVEKALETPVMEQFAHSKKSRDCK